MATDYSNKCFLIRPIGKAKSVPRRDTERLVKQIIEPALKDIQHEGNELKLIRADLDLSPSIDAGMIKAIETAPLCVVYLNKLNPNVMYEFGVRAAWDLPVIAFAPENLPLPFDIRRYRVIRTPRNDELPWNPQTVKKKVKQLHNRIKSDLTGHTVGIPELVNSMKRIRQASSIHVVYYGLKRTVQRLRADLKKLKNDIDKDSDQVEAGDGYIALADRAMAIADDLEYTMDVFQETLYECENNGSDISDAESHFEAIDQLGSAVIAWGHQISSKDGTAKKRKAAVDNQYRRIIDNLREVLSDLKQD